MATASLGSGLLTEQQAAEYLGVSAGTLSVWRSTRRYPLAFIKVGHLVRYRLTDLQKFLESRTVTPVDAGAAL